MATGHWTVDGSCATWCSSAIDHRESLGHRVLGRGLATSMPMSGDQAVRHGLLADIHAAMADGVALLCDIDPPHLAELSDRLTTMASSARDGAVDVLAFLASDIQSSDTDVHVVMQHRTRCSPSSVSVGTSTSPIARGTALDGLPWLSRTHAMAISTARGIDDVLLVDTTGSLRGMRGGVLAWWGDTGWQTTHEPSRDRDNAWASRLVDEGVLTTVPVDVADIGHLTASPVVRLHPCGTVDAVVAIDDRSCPPPTVATDALAPRY